MKFVLTKIENLITDEEVILFHGEVQPKEYVLLPLSPADIALMKEADEIKSPSLHLQVLAMLFRKDEEQRTKKNHEGGKHENQRENL